MHLFVLLKKKSLPVKTHLYRDFALCPVTKNKKEHTSGREYALDGTDLITLVCLSVFKIVRFKLQMRPLVKWESKLFCSSANLHKCHHPAGRSQFANEI